MTTKLLQATALAIACVLSACSGRTDVPQAPAPATPVPTTAGRSAVPAGDPVTGFNECRRFSPGVMPRVPGLQEKKPRDLCFDAFAILY